MARPSKLTEELITEFCDEVSKGLPIKYCCDYVGIHETSYFEWMKKGEDDFKNEIDSLYSTFWKSIKKSYAQYLIASREIIHNGVLGWQGRSWWLERTNPFFMPKQQIQADDDGKVTVVIGGKSKDIKRDNNK